MVDILLCRLIYISVIETFAEKGQLVTGPFQSVATVIRDEISDSLADVQ
jgi:hypothetical protein